MTTRYPAEPVARIAAITGCSTELARELYDRRNDPAYSASVEGSSRTMANYVLYRAGVHGSSGAPGMHQDFRPLRAFARSLAE